MPTEMTIEEALTSQKYPPNSLAELLNEEGFFNNLTGEAILKWQRPQGRLNESGTKKVFLKVAKDPGKNGRNYIRRSEFITFYNELLK